MCIRDRYNITNGDELPQTGVIQMAKVYIAKKRKLNLSYKGKKPNFERDQFKTLAEMKAFYEADIDEVHASYCLEDGKRYTFKSSNSVDPTTGRWRVENNPGGGVEVPSCL